jgi:hypothetical protein
MFNQRTNCYFELVLKQFLHSRAKTLQNFKDMWIAFSSGAFKKTLSKEKLELFYSILQFMFLSGGDI